MSHNREAQALRVRPRPPLLLLLVAKRDRNFVDGEIGVAYITERKHSQDRGRALLVITRGLYLERSWISLDQIVKPVLTTVDCGFLFLLEERTLLASIPGLQGDRSAAC